jgi:hypothetical protein
MFITKIADFSKDSFVFEDAIENKFGSKKINLTALDQDLLLEINNHGLERVSQGNFFPWSNFG